MATIKIEYGKPKKDGSRAVYIIISSGATKKRVNTKIKVEKNEVKESTSGMKITNKYKSMLVQEKLSEFQMKSMEIQRNLIGITLSADTIYDKIANNSPFNAVSTDFFSFAYRFVSENIKHAGTRSNYVAALRSLQRFNKNSRYLPFAGMTVQFVQSWIRSLEGTHRAKSNYPTLVKYMYNQACLEYNTDEDTNISPRLFDKIKIPRTTPAGQRALSLDEVRRFFALTPQSKAEEIVIDSAKLSFCLIGTNSVDLYSASEYRSGKICYERTKTRTRRADRARIEIKVREEIKPLVDKYRDKKSERVFNFYLRYSTPCVYNKCLNTILKRLGKRIGVDGLQFYQFRHSWATIARNELNIDIATIDEALNHKIPHHALIDVYVKKDFRNINLANKKVIDFVFGNSSN